LMSSSILDFLRDLPFRSLTLSGASLNKGCSLQYSSEWLSRISLGLASTLADAVWWIGGLCLWKDTSISLISSSSYKVLFAIMSWGSLSFFGVISSSNPRRFY
jgi:hypothetical protein